MYMDPNTEVTIVQQAAPRNELVDKIFYGLIGIFILLVCIVLYIIIKRMITVITNSKKIYHESILKMNTRYGNAKRESEKAAIAQPGCADFKSQARALSECVV